jgi:hypothetical protein
MSDPTLRVLFSALRAGTGKTFIAVAFMPNRFEFAGNEHARALEQAWISVWAVVFLIISLAFLMKAIINR